MEDFGIAVYNIQGHHIGSTLTPPVIPMATSPQDDIARLAEAHGPAAVEEMIRTCHNSLEASVDGGEVWIAHPQRGHWLDHDHLAALVNHIKDETAR
jgi:hypothetical protein